MADPLTVLWGYVEAHNRAVRGYGYGNVLERFCPEAHYLVDGTGVGRLRRRAIAASFRRHELIIWRIGTSAHAAWAHYAFRDRPAIGGVLHIDMCGERIHQLMLRPGASGLGASHEARATAY